MRARLAFATLTLALTACPKPAPPGPPPEPDLVHPWPMFRGSANHAGNFSDRRTPAWKVRWTAELRERVDASAVVTADHRVIVATRGGTVAAFDARTGEPTARTRLSAGVWSSPALSGDTLILATEDGHLIGLAASDLSQRWRRAAPARSFSAITVHSGRAFVCSGSSLLAFSARSGRVAWRVDLGAPSFTAPAIRDDLLVVGTRGGDVLGFDLAGKPKWMARTTAGAHNDGSPAIADGRVFIGSNDQALHAFDAASGRALWSAPGDNWVVSTPAVLPDAIVVADDGGLVRALAPGDGHELWRSQVGDDMASSPTLVGELIVSGAHDDQVHGHHRADGSALEPIEAGAPMFASPAVDSDGAIFIATHEGRVIAIE